MPDTRTHDEKLIAFARQTLLILQHHHEWNADTIDEIGTLANVHDLSTLDDEGLFLIKSAQTTSTPQPLPLW